MPAESDRSRSRPRWPLTLIAGAAIIAAAEGLLLIDVVRRGGAVVPGDELPASSDPLGAFTHQIALNMTPICWLGYLLAVEGLLAMMRSRRGADDLGSPARLRPRLFVLCFLTSIPIWLYFDWINFRFMDAWRYHNLPGNMVHRYAGYFLAFGAINPAMFLAAELYQQLGLRRWRARALPIGRVSLTVIFMIGMAFTALPFVLRDPLANLTLWLCPLLLLDPVNAALGAPSIFRDWSRGRYGRTVSLLAGGLTCGFLWEFWNYWAGAKWTYHLEFLGALEDVRYFEMPVIGLLGFLPFGVSSWVMFQTVMRGLAATGLVDRLPVDDGVVL